MAPQVFVKKWVDYSSKYGLGFLMSDLSVGINCNDETVISAAKDAPTFQYTTMKPSLQHTTYEFALMPLNSDIGRKIDLLIHFRNYLTDAAT